MKVNQSSRTRHGTVTDEQRVLDFFKESTITPFEEIPTTLITGIVTLQPGTNIDARVLFENVPIYEIPEWQRGKNKKIEIPYPGVPYAVLSVKCGRQVRGIVKNLADIAPKEQSKKKLFPNQVSLDVSLSDKNVNIFVFPNSLKVSGAQRPEHLVEAFVFIKAILLSLQRQGHQVFQQSPIVTKFESEMENVSFNLGYKVRKDVLLKKAVEEGLFCPPEADAVRIGFPMGKTKKKSGEPRYYGFRIHHTGAVIFSGDSRTKMKPFYDTFMNFISRHENDIRFN